MNFHGLKCGLGRIFRNERLMVPINSKSITNESNKTSNSIISDVPVRISKKVDQQ